MGLFSSSRQFPKHFIWEICFDCQAQTLLWRQWNNQTTTGLLNIYRTKHGKKSSTQACFPQGTANRPFDLQEGACVFQDFFPPGGLDNFLLVIRHLYVLVTCRSCAGESLQTPEFIQ